MRVAIQMARCMESSLGLAGRRWWSRPTQTPQLPCSPRQGSTQSAQSTARILRSQGSADDCGSSRNAHRPHRGVGSGRDDACPHPSICSGLGEYWYKLDPHRTRAYRGSHSRPERRAESGTGRRTRDGELNHAPLSPTHRNDHEKKTPPRKKRHRRRSLAA